MLVKGDQEVFTGIGAIVWFSKYWWSDPNYMGKSTITTPPQTQKQELNA